MGFLSGLLGKSNQKLALAIKNGAFLVDVRTPSEFSKGSVRNAVNIPLQQIETHINKFKDKKCIVVFCESGMRSRRAKNILASNGFREVLNGKTWRKVKRLSNR